MAIQVSGTEVISNARALTNVASIDATTAAAISAGGVGGGIWSEESVTTISSGSTTVNNLVIPATGSMCMIILEGIVYGNTGYRNQKIRLSTDGGSSYWSSNGHYKRYDGGSKDAMDYKESTQNTNTAYASYSSLILQGLPSGQYSTAVWSWGMQWATTGGSPNSYFEAGGYYTAGSYLSATTARPDRFQLTSNMASTYTAGTVRVYSFNA